MRLVMNRIACFCFSTLSTGYTLAMPKKGWRTASRPFIILTKSEAFAPLDLSGLTSEKKHQKDSMLSENL